MKDMFCGSQLKIERAQKHINELEAKIRDFAKGDSHTVRVEYDVRARCNVFHITMAETAPTNFALIIGDAIHNLRAALDFAWFETVCTFSSSDLNYAKFPIKSTKDEVIAAINGRKIPPSSQAIGDFMVDIVKPYKRGNDTLWAIHDMDITDKHWYLIPSLEMMAIHGVRVEDESDEEITLPLWVVSPGFPTTYRYFEYGNLKITDNGKAAFLINFSRGLPVEGQPVVPTLKQFTEAVSEVIEGFRALFP